VILPSGMTRLGIMSAGTNGTVLFIEDTIVSDSGATGIAVFPGAGGGAKTTLSRITANSNAFGVASTSNDMTIANSVLSNNSASGLQNDSGTTWLAKTVISGNSIGVKLTGTSVVNSYGDNYIRDNVTPVIGALTPVTTQ
jgi:hypothetical protein